MSEFGIFVYFPDHNVYNTDAKLTRWLNRMQIMGSKLFSKRLRMNMNKVPLQFMVFFAQSDEFLGVLNSRPGIGVFVRYCYSTFLCKEIVLAQLIFFLSADPWRPLKLDGRLVLVALSTLLFTVNSMYSIMTDNSRFGLAVVFY